ncbi:MAG TPA: FecR family protein, partial [Bdellovibrionota bacterium]|nr:FecR family protein [Bdellovibrionota bacterium]
GKDTKVTLKEDQEVALGTWIITDDKTSVRLLYPDNSQLFIGKNTKIHVTVHPKNKEVPVTTLNQGQARTLVTKSKDKAKTKFLMRTKSMVLAVRGTDFVTHANIEGKNEARAHTLEGEVLVADPAKQDEIVAGGSGTPLKTDMEVRSVVGTIEAPKAFDRGAFLKMMNDMQPGFSVFQNKIPRQFNEIMKLKGAALEQTNLKLQQAQQQTAQGLQKSNTALQQTNSTLKALPVIPKTPSMPRIPGQ